MKKDNLYETYSQKVRPNYTKKINEDYVDFQKIIESIEKFVKRKIGTQPKLNFDSLSESIFSIQSENMYVIPAFDKIIIESPSAEWKNGKMCVELNWKYYQKSGMILQGDKLCQLELDATGNILKHN